MNFAVGRGVLPWSMSSPPITSPFAPDLAQVGAWIEKMIAAMRFVELVTAILALFAKMAELNADLTRHLAQTRRKHPRSETLERLSRQLALPLLGDPARDDDGGRADDDGNPEPDEPDGKRRRRRHPRA